MTVYLLTGIQAAGKSTVAEALARRFERGVHVRGDVFRRMVVSGRDEMSVAPSDEALAQLRLRYELGAMVADRYADAGFTVVLQDIFISHHLPDQVDRIRHRPLHVVVLCPRPDVVAEREAGRAKTAYGKAGFSVEDLDRALREKTPRIVLWLDTSDLTLDETVDRILAVTTSYV